MRSLKSLGCVGVNSEAFIHAGWVSTPVPLPGRTRDRGFPQLNSAARRGQPPFAGDMNASSTNFKSGVGPKSEEGSNVVAHALGCEELYRLGLRQEFLGSFGSVGRVITDFQGGAGDKDFVVAAILKHHGRPRNKLDFMGDGRYGHLWCHQSPFHCRKPNRSHFGP